MLYPWLPAAMLRVIASAPPQVGRWWTFSSYLFFLKRGALGWEPATGHAFPNQSVFPLMGASRVGGY
jgi:hypothetical protein